MDLRRKVVEYEAFLNDKLKTDLKVCLEQRDELFENIAEYMKLQTTIETMKSTSLKDGDMRVMVDLGSQFFCQADVPDTSRVFVHVGFGLHVEYTLEEAIEFLEKKNAQLRLREEAVTKQISEIKALMQLVLEGLREIQGLDPNEAARESHETF